MRQLYRLKDRLPDIPVSVSQSTHAGFLIYWGIGIGLISQSTALAGNAKVAVPLWTALCAFKWYVPKS